MSSAIVLDFLRRGGRSGMLGRELGLWFGSESESSFLVGIRSEMGKIGGVWVME